MGGLYRRMSSLTTLTIFTGLPGMTPLDHSCLDFERYLGEDLWVGLLRTPMTAPKMIVTTITMARAMIPLVSPGVSDGTGVTWPVSSDFAAAGRKAEVMERVDSTL